MNCLNCRKKLIPSQIKGYSWECPHCFDIFKEKKEVKMKEAINTFDLWTENWTNAKAFFDSKGNIGTRSKLKAKWYKDFMNMFKVIEERRYK